MTTLPLAAARYSHRLPWQDLTSVYMIYIQYAATLDTEIPMSSIYPLNDSYYNCNTQNRWGSLDGPTNPPQQLSKFFFLKLWFQEIERLGSLDISKSWLRHRWFASNGLKYPETFLDIMETK